MASLHAKQGNYWRIKRGCARGYEEHIGRMTAEGKAGIFLAEVDGEAVGFVTAEVARRAPCFVHREHGIIGDLAVTERCRRTGIGRKLCARALRWISGQGLQVAEVRVSADNPLATGFWAKMGFRPYMSMMKLEVRRSGAGDTESRRKSNVRIRRRTGRAADGAARGTGGRSR